MRATSGAKPETRYHTKAELSTYLNVSISSVDRQRKKGIIPYYRLSGQIRFVFEEVDASLAKNCRVSGREKLPLRNGGPALHSVPPLHRS